VDGVTKLSGTTPENPSHPRLPNKELRLLFAYRWRRVCIRNSSAKLVAPDRSVPSMTKWQYGYANHDGGWEFCGVIPAWAEQPSEGGVVQFSLIFKRPLPQ
jgi:hypothetical protein